MNWGYCGSDPSPPCHSFAEGLGSLGLTFLAMIAFIFAAFMVVRLVYLAFHFESRWAEDKHIAELARVQVLAMAWEKEDAKAGDTTKFIQDLYDNLDAEAKRREKLDLPTPLYRRE